MKFLIEVFIPQADPQGNSFPPEMYHQLEDRLVRRFGGVTAFARAPANGLWADPKGKVECDEIVIFEVMAESLDRSWWQKLREELEQQFQQDQILIRLTHIQTL